jgi:hypothetical protein
MLNCHKGSKLNMNHRFVLSVLRHIYRWMCFRMLKNASETRQNAFAAGAPPQNPQGCS